MANTWRWFKENILWEIFCKLVTTWWGGTTVVLAPTVGFTAWAGLENAPLSITVPIAFCAFTYAFWLRNELKRLFDELSPLPWKIEFQPTIQFFKHEPETSQNGLTLKHRKIWWATLVNTDPNLKTIEKIRAQIISVDPLPRKIPDPAHGIPPTPVTVLPLPQDLKFGENCERSEITLSAGRRDKIRLVSYCDIDFHDMEARLEGSNEEFYIGDGKPRLLEILFTGDKIKPLSKVFRTGLRDGDLYLELAS